MIPVKNSRVFVALIVMMIVVAGSIALPEVWLLPNQESHVPAEIFDNSASSVRVRDETCIGERCYYADGSRMIERQGSSQRVVWVINPENPLTKLPVDENGVEENVRIVRISESAEILYVELGSGRTIVRDREGDWNPGVGEFRAVAGPAALLAALAALATLVVARIRAGWTSPMHVVVAGVFAVLSHLPITVWRFTTTWSLSTVFVPTVAFLGLACAGGFLIGARGPKPGNVRRT